MVLSLAVVRVERKVGKDGIITTNTGNGESWFRGDGGPAFQASFGVIQDIAVDTQGVVTTLASDTWVKIMDEEIHPNGIAINKSGEIFISDSGSSKIRKIDRDQNVTTFAGTESFGISAWQPGAIEKPLPYGLR